MFYILRKEISSERAVVALRKLRTLTGVLPVDEQTVDMALSSSFKDFEDAIQYYAASSNNAEAILTRNKKDYEGSKIPVLTAGEWLELHGAKSAGEHQRTQRAGPKPAA